MAVSVKNTQCFGQGIRASPSRNRIVQVCCQKQGDSSAVLKSQLAAVTLATVTLLSCCPADAGVVLQQPEIKKVFQSEQTSAPVVRSSIPRQQKTVSAPKQETVEFKKEEPFEYKGPELDPRSVALPGSIFSVAALGFAASKLDGGFDEFMTEAMVKDSNNFAGYEPLIKEGNVAVLARGTQALGTRKVKASKKK